MGEQRHSIVLGFDGTAWTSAEIEAEIRSLSEPDRKVPLMTQLVGTPDIFDYTVPEGAQEKFKAAVRLKPKAAIPESCQGTIVVIADPATEIMMGVASAFSPVPLPLTPLPQMRATVDVTLVPFDLEVTWNNSKVAPGETLLLEGDGQSSGRARAAACRVDSSGNPSGHPEQAQLQFTSEPDTANQWFTVQSAGSDLALLGDLKSCKIHVGRSTKSVGTLVASAVVQGHKLQRRFPVEVEPISLTLLKPGVGELKPGESLKLEVQAYNSRGKGVSGVEISWALSSQMGQLSAAQSLTDENGKATVVYTAPAAEELQGQSKSVTVTARAGKGEQSWEESLSLDLLFLRKLEVRFTKLGFEELVKTFDVPVPSIQRIRCTAGTTAFGVYAAKVNWAGGSGTTDSQGYVSVPVGEGGATRESVAALPLARECQNRIEQIERDFKSLNATDWTTDYLEQSGARTCRYANEDFVKRLAAEPEESFQVSFDNLKLVGVLVRVAEKNRALFRRRFSRLAGEVEGFFYNLAGAVFSVFGDKIFSKLADYISSGARRVFGWLAGKCGGNSWLMSLAKRSGGTLKSLLAGADEKIKALRSKLGSVGAPQEITSKIPKSSASGPFKTSGSELLDMKAFQEGLQKARDMIAKATKQLETYGRELQEAEAKLLTLKNKGKIKNLEREINTLKSQIGNAKASLKEGEAALKTAADSESKAVFEELLGDIFGCLNRIVLMGQLAIAWLCGAVLEASNKALRKSLRQTYAGMDDSIGSIFNDKVYKPIFQVSTGGWVGPGISRALEESLVKMQSNGIATVLDDVIDRAQQWNKIDLKPAKEGIEKYYSKVDAASFNTEADEVMQEYVADVLDWIEFVIVWSVRIANVVLGILSALTALISMGTSLLAYVAVSAGLTAFVEVLDTIWDCLKAVGRGFTSVTCLNEIIGTVLPAHSQLAATAYQDDALLASATRGWAYNLDTRNTIKRTGQPPDLLKKAVTKVENLEEDSESRAIKLARFIKDEDVTSIFKEH